MDKLKSIQNSNFQGIPDVSQIAKFREREEWEAKRKKAAAKCEEIVNIARAVIIESPTFSVDEALHLAEEFYEKASSKVDILMEAVGPEPEESGLVV